MRLTRCAHPFWRVERTQLSYLNLKYNDNARRLYAVMANRTYDEAVDLLNTLQTPYSVLKQRWDAGIRLDKTAKEEMRKCLARIGYTQSDLDKLNVVHVAGTKGKGSTCAYVDSILFHHRKNRRTVQIPKNIGLFTSPHLIAVRERIRINGIALSRHLFAKYFFEVWDALEVAAKSEGPFEKPAYFRYLNLMSYHAFLREEVDVAIYEVGIGGEYDATNFVDRPVVTGISKLGIDHTFILGETIDKIAWHKAGIQKKGVPSLTVKQLPEAMEVIEHRAKEIGVKGLTVVEIDPRLGGVMIKPNANFQRENASLAIALSETVLKKVDSEFQVEQNTLPKSFIDGLEQVAWRGRFETKHEGNITWYLDGAHTTDSIKVASQWYGDEGSQSAGTRILIFNQQGQREALSLLEGLFTAIKTQGVVHFDHVIFCTSAVSSSSSAKDATNNMQDAQAITSLTLQKSFAEKWRELDPSPSTTIEVLTSVEDALEYVRALDKTSGVEGKEIKPGKQFQVLITGSLHLVGRAIGVLDGIDAAVY